MRDWLLYIFAFLTVVLLGIVGIAMFLFSESGNRYIASFIQKKIDEKLETKVTLSEFKLSSKKIFAKLTTNNGSFIQTSGSYSILKRSFDGEYRANITNLEDFSELIGYKLRGQFITVGNLKIGVDENDIKGVLDAFGGQIEYTVSIKESSPLNIILKSTPLDISKLLYFANQPSIAGGTLVLNANITSKNNALSYEDTDIVGDANIKIEKGTIYKSTLAKAYNINIHKNLPFKGVIKSNIAGSVITTNGAINSELANATISNLTYNIQKRSLSGDVELNIATIQLPNLNIYKPFYIRGKIEGKGKESTVNITSNILDSDTKANIVLKKMKPSSLTADVRGITLGALSNFVKKPGFAEGELVISAKIEDLDKNDANGLIDISSQKINIPIEAQKKFIGIKNAKSDIQARVTSKTKIAKNIANTDLEFLSSIAKIKSKKITYDIGKKELDSEVDIHIPDLKKIAFITGKELAGAIDINNKIGIKNGELEYKGYSKALGGEININFAKELLKIDATNIQATKLGKMLQLGDLLQGGTFLLDANLHIPKNATEPMRAISGRSIFRGENFTLNGYNIDTMIDNLKDTQSINLMDIGALVVGGPLGIAATKGVGVGKRVLGSTGGVTLIKEMLVDLNIKNGVANAKDVAFTTKTNLIAAKGSVRLWDYGLENFWIAILNKQGCAEFKQEIGGTLNNPKIKATQTSFEVIKNVVKSVGFLFGDTIGKTVDALGGSNSEKKCDRFYNGSVKYPK